MSCPSCQICKWYRSKVIAVRDMGKGPEIKIHYIQWSDASDEWIPLNSPRIAPLNTRAKPVVCALAPLTHAHTRHP